MGERGKLTVPDDRFSLTRADASEQIAYEIRRHIEREGLRPGDRIGTEQELAGEFGVSRPTLREALRLLAGSHLIRASQGRGGGIFVANTPRDGMGRNMSEAIATMLATESVSMYELL
jgi:GntR family transcriptional regulator, transcriptional repressor for pyruvate dehydrogenase complex